MIKLPKILLQNDATSEDFKIYIRRTNQLLNSEFSAYLNRNPNYRVTRRTLAT